MNDRFLVYGHGGCYNHGAEAITRTTIEFLRNISTDCHITLSSYFEEQDREFDLQPDCFAKRNPDGKTNAEIYAQTLAAITKDTIGIHVGGDNYCYKNWQRYAEIHYALKKNGKKSILWGCSIDENMVNEEMKEVLLSHDLILAREEITYRMLKKLGAANVIRVSDIAFTMQPKETMLPAEEYVCINISPLVCKRNEAAITDTEKLVRYLLKNTTFSIVFVPHVTMPMDNDYALQCELAKKFTGWEKRIFVCSDKLSAAEYKYIISKSKLCISARTHAVIAAYSSCVPAISIGYSTKARGIAEDVGMEDYVVDIGKMSESALIKMTEKCLRNRHLLQKQLETRVPLCMERAMNSNIIHEILK